MPTRLALIVLAALLATAPSAHASAPVDLGPGRNPSAIVDADGTAHVVFRSNSWAGEQPAGASYCRLPRRASACDARAFLPLPTHPDAVRVFRRAADGALVVAAGAGGSIYTATSHDGGVTFSALTPLGAGTSPVVVGDTLLSVSGSEEGVVVGRPGDPRVVRLGDADTWGTSAVALPGGRLLITAAVAGGGTEWWVSKGGDPLDPGSWSSRRTLGARKPVVAAGPRGVFLLEDWPIATELIEGVAGFGVRSFDTRRSRWRGPRDVGADQSGLDADVGLYARNADLFQDAKGRLHLLSTSGESGTARCVQYARTGARRSQWFGRTTTLFVTPARQSFAQAPQVAAGPDGHGVATWHMGPEPHTGNVFAMPLRQAKGRYRPIANQFERPLCGRR